MCVVVVQICVFRVWLGVVGFGRLSRFLLMGSYRFWIVGVGWQWFACAVGDVVFLGGWVWFAV